MLLTQYHAFANPFTTPYDDHLRQGLGSDQSNYRVAWIPSHVRQSGSPILLVFPLLPLAPVGIMVFARSTRDRVRIVWVTAAIASVASTMFYLSFIAGGAGDIKFSNQRYWAVWYPLWSVLVVVCIAIFVRYIQNHVRTPDASDLPAFGGK